MFLFFILLALEHHVHHMPPRLKPLGIVLRLGLTLKKVKPLIGDIRNVRLVVIISPFADAFAICIAIT